MVAERYQSKAVDATPLGQPLHFAFSGQTAQNRFLKAAMTERLSSWSPTDLPKRGVPSEELINVYRRWGEGGYGVILSGNIMMEYDQLEAPGNPIIPRDAPFSGERFEAFKKMAAAGKKEGALFVGQVSHPGRQTEKRLQPNPVSASDVQLQGNIMGMEFAKPHPASDEEIKNLIEGFAHAAEYLHKAGYDGIQLHGAHGYLLAQFLSQTTNLRKDRYGGDLKSRVSLITDIGAAVRARVPPSFILGIKINSVEFQDKGFTPEEATQMCQMLEEARFDFIELSGGTYESTAFAHKRESTKKREAFFLEFAEQICKPLKQTKTYVTGGLRTVAAMVDGLTTVDGVGLARPACQEPNFPKLALAGKINSAVKQRFDDNNFGLTNVVAGSQIRQMGRDQHPFDGSKAENQEAFQKDMGEWMHGMTNDKEMNKYGYVDMHAVHSVPYGSIASL